MREPYDKQGDSTEAVATGLQVIGRMVVSAAPQAALPCRPRIPPARFYVWFAIKETDMAADGTADKPAPATVS
jgi:hypothetical protein